MNGPHWTANPRVDRLIEELFASIQAIFGPHLVGLYLDGSLTSGDYDQDSDVDFVAVTDGEISTETFAALQAMHDRLAAQDPLWGVQFEGSYLPDYALRRYDPAHCSYPNLERGTGERLKLWAHDETYDVHRYILRERGIVLAGPPPASLIDPVPPDQLRSVMGALLSSWGVNILRNPQHIQSRGYQSYVVLSICRILFTLQSGEIVSKPAALAWARANLEARWQGLLERAWQGRSNPGMDIDPQDLDQTFDLLRYTLRRAGLEPV